MADQGNGVYIWDADHNEFRYIGQVIGGTTVEANPSGTATGDLSKIGIAGTIYNINGLPVIASGDAGKVLVVNAGETGVEWTTPSGGGGDVFAQRFFSRGVQIANVYDDPQYTNKVYARENGTPFTFSANTDYYLESEVIQLSGQQIFLDPIQNYWLGYFAKAGADAYDIATTYGVPLLEDFGNDATLMLLPDSSTVSLEGSNNFSGITGEKNMFKSLIMPVKPADVNVNVVDDKITLKFYFMITPTTSITWTPSQYGVDFNISCTNGQLTMAGSDREL